MTEQPASDTAVPSSADPDNPASEVPISATTSGQRRIIVWALTRVMALAIWGIFARHVVGDVNYYWRKINAMGEVGLANTLIEYPTPVVGLLGIPWLLGGASQYLYVVFFVVAMIALDAWLFRLLLRHRGANRWAVWTWILAVPALGPLSYLRFDMIPAVLAGVALLWYRQRPTASGALIGLGAATKLWPALLLPALFADRAKRISALIGFAVAGFGLAAYSLAIGGWDRLISPLTWQSGRGLQIESVWVVPAMVARLVQPDAYTVEMSPFQAFELFGPLTGAMVLAASVSTVIGGLFIVALAIRCWRNPGFTLHTAAWVMLAVTAVMIATNKTFSPQYMLWLAGPAAVLALGVPDRDLAGADHRARRTAALGVVVLSALTQIIYPFLYDDLVANGYPGVGTVVVTVLLAIRNVAVLVGTGWVCVQAWRSVRHAATRIRPGSPVG